MNLTFAIEAVKKKIREIEQRQIAELAPYEDSLDALRAINTACEGCSGTGEAIYGKTYFMNEEQNRKCNLCAGTGRNGNAPAAIAQW